jgi:hypothetical protein
MRKSKIEKLCKGRRCKYNNYYNNFNNGEISRNPQTIRGRGRRNSNSRYHKSRVKCYNCDKFGHHAFECRALSDNRVEEKANYVEERSQEDETLLTYKYNE